jgi:DNA invertase Pin-like site-specific DNA recombinase
MSNYKLGYARVSTLDQDPALQHDASCRDDERARPA